MLGKIIKHIDAQLRFAPDGNVPELRSLECYAYALVLKSITSKNKMKETYFYIQNFTMAKLIKNVLFINQGLAEENNV